ncbi:MAG: hypothetical protein JWO19_833 [Bryobacterales bacterium]|nr:hypothetical protein [Bryobacterales bacterium]
MRRIFDTSLGSAPRLPESRNVVYRQSLGGLLRDYSPAVLLLDLLLILDR